MEHPVLFCSLSGQVSVGVCGGGCKRQLCCQACRDCRHRACQHGRIGVRAISEGWGRGWVSKPASPIWPFSKIPDDCLEGLAQPVQDRDVQQVVIPTKCLWHLLIIYFPDSLNFLAVRSVPAIRSWCSRASLAGPAWGPCRCPGYSHQSSWPLLVQLHFFPS